MELISTAPTVAYLVTLGNGHTVSVENPAHMPPMQDILKLEEPFILATFHVPADYVGPVLTLCEERRGRQREIRYLGDQRVLILYELPLGEVIIDFYDKLKALTRGYASMDYDTLGNRDADLARLGDFLTSDDRDRQRALVVRPFYPGPGHGDFFLDRYVAAERQFVLGIGG